MNAGQRRVERGCETNAARGSPRREGGRARGGAATRRARIRDARGSATPPTPVRPAREKKPVDERAPRGGGSRPPGGSTRIARASVRAERSRAGTARRGGRSRSRGRARRRTRRTANPSEKCQRASEGGADARVREARTVELDETLALLAVDHRDGGLLATEALDLMRGGAWGRRRQSRVPGRVFGTRSAVARVLRERRPSRRRRAEARSATRGASRGARGERRVAWSRTELAAILSRRATCATCHARL